MPLGSSSAAPVISPGPRRLVRVASSSSSTGSLLSGIGVGMADSDWLAPPPVRGARILWHGLCTHRADPPRRARCPGLPPPSDPDDADRPLALRCGCGRWHAATEHEVAPADAPITRSRLEATVLRALFPSEPLRRRFLHAVGASTALAAIASLFPLGALEAFAQSKAPLEKKNLKVGFIPITCATPIIMAASAGLLRAAGPQRRRRQDRRLGGDPRQDAQQGIRRGALPVADAARDHAGPGLDAAFRCTLPTIQNINGQAITLRDEAQGQARSEARGRASSSPCRSTTRCTTSCCATTWRSTGSIPTRTSRSASCRRPRWSPTCAPTTSTASSGPIRSTSARSTTASASSTSCPRKSGTAIRAAPSPRARSSSQQYPNTFARCTAPSLDRRGHGARSPKNRKQIAKAIAPPNYLNQPVTVVEQVLTGKFADGLGNVQERARPHRLRSVSVADHGGVDPHADEALGPGQGRRRLQADREQVFLLTDAKKQHEGSSGMKPPAATIAKFTRHGQGVRSGEARRVPRRASRSRRR